MIIESREENKWIAICGSRDASKRMRDYAKSAAQHALNNGWVLFVGDNPRGVDRAVISYALHNSYGPAVMYTGLERPRAIESLKGRTIRSKSPGQMYTLRDRTMLEFMDSVMCIWDGKSPGTYASYKYARELGLEIWLVDFSKTDKQTGQIPRLTYHESKRDQREREANLPTQEQLL